MYVAGSMHRRGHIERDAGPLSRESNHSAAQNTRRIEKKGAAVSLIRHDKVSFADSNPWAIRMRQRRAAFGPRVQIVTLFFWCTNPRVDGAMPNGETPLYDASQNGHERIEENSSERGCTSNTSWVPLS